MVGIEIIASCIIALILSYLSKHILKIRVSTHAAIVSSLTASLFFIEGMSNLVIAIGILSLIVLRDAIGVRYVTGEQSKVINKLSKNKVPLLLGHNTNEILLGSVLGIIVAFIVVAL